MNLIAKSLVSLTLIFSLISCSDSDDDSQESIVGTWCVDKSLQIYKLDFTESRMFHVRFDLGDDFTLRHGTWTISDGELLQKESIGENRIKETVSDVSFESSNKMILTTKLIGKDGEWKVQDFESNTRSFIRCE